MAMKIIYLVLFLLGGCTVARYYQASDVSLELKKNSQQLTALTFQVERDFSDKEAFYENYYKENPKKDNFILGDLAYRLNDLKIRKDSILSKSQSIKKVNDELLTKIQNKKRIQETDPEYQDIEAFAVINQRDAKGLFEDFSKYRSASNEFATFALFTGNLWKKSSSVK